MDLMVISLLYCSTLVFAIRLPHAHFIKNQLCFEYYYHIHKIHQLLLLSIVVIVQMCDMVLTQGNLYGQRDNIFSKATLLHISNVDDLMFYFSNNISIYIHIFHTEYLREPLVKPHNV